MRKSGFILLLALLFGACNGDDSANLQPVDERIAEAVTELHELLMAPENGWVLNYQPTNDAGTYYILLDFDETEVHIQSDLPDEDGYYHNQTIPYRIDPQLSIELIFETYAVFHFLFEQDQSTSGAEFQFSYLGESSSSLLFSSKSDDADDLTVISLDPASSNADAAFSRDLATNLSHFDTLAPVEIFQDVVMQQVYFEAHDISVFWDIDLEKRSIEFDFAAQGETISEIILDDNRVSIDHFSGYSLINGTFTLDDPASFDVSGQNITITEIALDDFSFSGDALCDASATPVYSGTEVDQGALRISHTLMQSGGFLFTEQEDSYAVNVLFVIDDSLNSLSEEGLINDYYPEATGFIFNFGFTSDDDPDEPAYSVGISFLDDDEFSQRHMRGYEMTAIEGNLINVQLTDEFYYSNTPEENSEDNLREITDEIFSDGEFYIQQVELDGLDFVLFKLFNPCTEYFFYLVQPESV